MQRIPCFFKHLKDTAVGSNLRQHVTKAFNCAIWLHMKRVSMGDNPSIVRHAGNSNYYSGADKSQSAQKCFSRVDVPGDFNRHPIKRKQCDTAAHRCLHQSAGRAWAASVYMHTLQYLHVSPSGDESTRPFCLFDLAESSPAKVHKEVVEIPPKGSVRMLHPKLMNRKCLCIADQSPPFHMCSLHGGAFQEAAATLDCS